MLVRFEKIHHRGPEARRVAFLIYVPSGYLSIQSIQVFTIGRYIWSMSGIYVFFSLLKLYLKQNVTPTSYSNNKQN